MWSRLGFGALCAMLANVAQATTLKALTTKELVQQSSAIGVARVVSVQPMRHSGRINTLATLEVVEPLKGLNEGQRIFVRVPGGVMGDYAQHVEGAPVMRDGDLSVVYLNRSGTTAYSVVGLEQGKLDVVRDPKDPEQWLVKSTVTAERVAPGPDGILAPVPMKPVTEPLEAYLDRVQSLVQEHP